MFSYTNKRTNVYPKYVSVAGPDPPNPTTQVSTAVEAMMEIHPIMLNALRATKKIITALPFDQYADDKTRVEVVEKARAWGKEAEVSSVYYEKVY